MDLALNNLQRLICHKQHASSLCRFYPRFFPRTLSPIGTANKNQKSLILIILLAKITEFTIFGNVHLVLSFI